MYRDMRFLKYENEPCPFCGSCCLQINGYKESSENEICDHFFVECTKCKARGSETNTEGEAWKIWNGRNSSDSFKKQIIHQKVNEFLALTPEQKRAIDENPQYDGLFKTIQEMSDTVESIHRGV